jgi:hypothetical protein
MSDPSLALQAAIVAALAGTTEAGTNVYDQVPATDAFPRITVGEGQTVGNFADCYDGSEVYLDVHVWSREVGFPEAKRIASAVRSALHDAPLTLTGHTLELLQFRDARYLRDPDGRTSHVAMTFRALTQPAD